MSEVMLGEIADINPRSGSIKRDALVSFVGMAELDAESAIAAPLETRQFGAVSSGYTVFRNEDILVAKITPCWENGKVGQAKLDHPIGVGSTEFHVVRPRGDVDGRFLLHFLRQSRVRVRGVGRMTGSAGQRRVPSEFLSSLRLKLPPLESQRQAVAILDQAADLQAKRRLLLRHLDSMVRSLFEDMFAGGNEPLVCFRDLTEYMRNGLSPSSSGTVKGTVLTLSAITQGAFDAHARKEAMFDREPSGRVRINPLDFLICRGNGNLKLVGAGVHPDEAYPELVFPDTVIAARVDPSRVDLNFLEAAWRRPQVRRQLESGARTTNGTHKVNQQTVGGIQLALPALGDQRVFAQKAELIRAQRRRVVNALSLGDELFESLQVRTFGAEA